MDNIRNDFFLREGRSVPFRKWAVDVEFSSRANLDLKKRRLASDGTGWCGRGLCWRRN